MLFYSLNHMVIYKVVKLQLHNTVFVIISISVANYISPYFSPSVYWAFLNCAGATFSWVLLITTSLKNESMSYTWLEKTKM